MYHRVIPLHCADFPENLAYEVGEDFGREYKTWLQGGGRDRGAKARVGFQLKKDLTHLLFQARQWVDMWHGHMGNAANRRNIIQALEECGGGADIIATLRSANHPSPVLLPRQPHTSPAPTPPSPSASSNSFPPYNYSLIQLGIGIFLSVFVAILYFYK